MSAQGNAARLRQKIALVFPAQAATGDRLLTHPRLTELYPEYLFILHCVARAAVPVMEAAKTRAEALAPADPVAAMLVTYLEKHIPEERGHAEWVLEDLEEVGGRREDILQRVPSATLASLVGAHYYWIFHYHPVALMGLLAVAEGYPPTVERVQDLMARTGYRKQAFRSLYRHALLEPSHRDDVNEILDALPLTPEQVSLIGSSALHTVNMIATAFMGLLDRYPSPELGTLAITEQVTTPVAALV